MGDVVKSIFRQKEFEKVYFIEVVDEHCRDRKLYLSELGFVHYEYHKRIMEKNAKLLSDKEIARYDIELPMLEVGDMFFLVDIQQEVKIKSRMRSSDGSITYYIEDKLLETENTERTKKECEEIVKKCDDLVQDNIDLNNKIMKVSREMYELQSRFDDYKEEYKYKHRFFNFKRNNVDE